MPLNGGLVKECQHELVRDEVHRLQHKHDMSIEISGDTPEAINSKGWAHILSNPRMPGLLKVGIATNSPYMRAKKLSSSTGVPGKSAVEGTYFSDDPRGDESAVHPVLNAHRANKSREFSKCFPAKTYEAHRSYYLYDVKSTLEELADGYAAICTDQPIKLNLHEWLEELDVSAIGYTANAFRTIFELRCKRLESMFRDGISITIEDSGAYGVVSELHQSLLAYLEKINEKEKLASIYDPRLPGGF